MANNNTATAAEVGIGRTEQLQIALQAMTEHDGIAEIKDIYEAIENRMSDKGFKLSQQGKDTLRAYINRDAVQAGYVDKEKNIGWKITNKGRNFLTEVIEDDEDTQEIDAYGDGSIYPYDMPEEVDIREDPQTIFEWMRKLGRKQLITDPDFQRNLVWKPEQKARFIESVLLNIPLPPLYVNQTVNGKYIIVDGLQRTSTLEEYILKDAFALQGLQVLTKLNGLRFSELSDELKTKIEDKKFFLYVIKPSVPLPMVYDIFHRINTGGTQLTRQEIRNCFYIGPATQLLKELSEQDYFKQAIGWGISDKRMKDREAVLRYLAFKLLDYKTDYKNDMDAFLGEAMKRINKMSKNKINELKQNFERVMKFAYDFFGERNFRLPTASTRGRINIALLESVSYFFSIKTDEFLQQNREKIQANYEHLLNNAEFIDAIRVSTGDTRRVINRFNLAQKILGNI
jgi:hypothetical protein